MLKVKRVLAVVAISALLAVNLTGCSEEEAAKEFPGINVGVYKMEKQPFAKQSVFYGEVSAKESVMITAKVPGTIAGIPFRNGDMVKAGDTLFSMTNSDVDSSLGQSKSALAVAQASLQKVQSGASTGEVQALEQSVNGAKVAYETAKTNFERMKILFESEAISRAQFEQAQAEMNMAESKYKSLNHQLEQMKSGPTQETVDVSRAQVGQAHAAYQGAMEKANDLQVISPISGQVSNITMDAGEWINPGMPLATVDDLSQMYVNIQVPEALYGQLKIGQKTEVAIASLGKKFTGTISEINPSADLRTKLFHIKVLVDNPGLQIKPGMTADVTVELDRRAGVLAVPINAVLNDKGESYVFVVRDGLARLTHVKEGVRNEQFVEVIDGLKEGDLIVTEGMEQIGDGEKVKIASPSK